MHTRRSTLCAGLVLVVLPACRESVTHHHAAAADPAHAKPPAAGTPKPGAPARAPAAPGQLRRDLVHEAARAELDEGGLFVDLGAADQHKYTLGGWHTGVGRDRRDGAVTAAPVEDEAATLHVVLARRATGLVVRGRSPHGPTKLAVTVDGHHAGTGTLGSTWSVARIALPHALPPGRHAVKLAPAVHDAELDWVWLAADAAAAADDATALPDTSHRAGELALAGQKHHALLSPTPRRYAYYLHVPPNAWLAFAPGSNRATAFTVQVTSDDGTSRQLYHHTAKPGTWTPARVDLAAFGDHTVRLELATSGPTGETGWGDVALRIPTPTPPPAAGPPAKNLIVLLIDTARADLFAPFATHGGIGAKAFDGLAADSTVFRHAYNNANWTKPSIATFDTGVYPGSHHARVRVDVVPDALEFLSEHLQAQGFHTAALVSNISAGPKFGFDQGWDSFTKTDNAADIFAKAQAWLEHRAPGRFYLYLQSIDAHTPYGAPVEYAKRAYHGTYEGKLGPRWEPSQEEAANRHELHLSDADVAWVRALYEGEVLYHDHYFGKFLAYLERTHLLDDTMLVVVNDHGEDLGEHGRFGHGWSQWDDLYHAIDTIHYPPLFPPGKAVEAITEHVDLAPTLADALGVPPLPQAQGVSLLPLVRGEPDPRPHYALLWARPDEMAIRLGRWKLVLARGRETGLYDLAADPSEQHDLLGHRPIARRACEVYLGEGIATYDKRHRLDDVTTNAQYTPGNIDAHGRRPPDPHTSE